MAENKLYYCNKCHKTMNAENFYTSKNLEKYPDGGKLTTCKQCITMHVNNWEPETYTWILEEIDVPYIPDEWNTLLARYAKDPLKITGTTILGRYLSKMKLAQYKDYRWADNDFVQELANNRIKQTMARQGYSAAEIAMAIEKGTVDAPPKPAVVKEEPVQEENYFTRNEEPVEFDITDEERQYLRFKWGSTYRIEELIRLEQLYEEMMSSYDIQSAGHIDTLKLVCKSSLKANQLIDIGDVEGASKMFKMYDGLMKSGKFTAAQNKGANGDYIDSISELVALCETRGFIPRYYTDGPQDKVDSTLLDLQNYTKTLITEEMNLGNLIEQALKQIENDKEKEREGDAEAADDDDIFENNLFSDGATDYITDENFSEFMELEELWEDEDALLFQEDEE